MTDVETIFLSQLKSNDAKQRLDSLTLLVPDEGPVSIQHLRLIAGILPSLLAEINPLALKKLYTALEEALRQDLIEPGQYPSLCTVLIEKGFSNPKTALKDQAKEILLALALQFSLHSPPGQSNVVIQALLTGLSAKSPKVVTESAFCLQSIVEKHGIFSMDVASFVRAVAPTFQNKDLKVRRAAMKIAALLAMKVGVEPIKAMLGPNMPKQYIVAFEGVMEETIQDLQSRGSRGDELGAIQLSSSSIDAGDKRAISPPVIIQRFTYDPFDDAAPTPFHLSKAWDKMIVDKNWKERKQVLDDQIKVLSSLTRIDRSQLQVTQIFKQLKAIVDADLSVAVVSASMRFAGALAVLIGPLGPYASTSKLLVTACTNRLKERKAPIIAGYNLFMHSLLVHSHRLVDISTDMWAVAIPHKNSEVKEDSCRLLRTLWASAIVYNTVFYLGQNNLSVQLPTQILQSAVNQGNPSQAPSSNSVDYFQYKELENSIINYLLNDGFPGSQKPIPEGTALSGELSPGLQLKSRVYRERACYNSILVDLTGQRTDIQDPGDLSGFNLVFDSLDKLLSDSSAVIRTPALKSFAFGVVAHISEVIAVFNGDIDKLSQPAYNLINAIKSRMSSKDTRKQTEISDLIRKICISTGRTDIFDILEGRVTPVVGQAKMTSPPAQQFRVTPDVVAPPQPKLFMPPSTSHLPPATHEPIGSSYSFAPPIVTTEQPNAARAKPPQAKPARSGAGMAPIPKEGKDNELTISTNPNLYNQRKASTIKWIVDPFNSDAPVSIPARDELYHQLNQIIPPSFVPNMFLKRASPGSQALLTGQQGVPRGVESKFTGTSKSILDTVHLLRNAIFESPQGAIAQRDVLMKYISLLFCDGFVAPATPNTTQIKAACQIADDLINLLIDNEVVLTIFDLDYLFPAILARLEQFNMTQIKVQIASLAERHVHLTSFENIINVTLMHLLGRNARLQIRQMPTRFALLRFVSVMAEASRDNYHCLELSLAPIQSLLSIYKSCTNTDTYTFSEGHLSENYPKFRGGSARTIFLTCLATIINACDSMLRGKLMPTIERTLTGKDFNDFHALILPCMESQQIEQIEQISQPAEVPLSSQPSNIEHPLNGFSPAEHYATTSMRGHTNTQVVQGQKNMQALNQPSFQGPSLLTEPLTYNNTTLQSAATSFSYSLSPQTGQLAQQLPPGPSALRQNHVTNHSGMVSANASATEAPSPLTLTTNLPTMVPVEKPPSPSNSFFDLFPPLVDVDDITLISPKVSSVGLHHSIDSTRTPTTSRQFQPRTFAHDSSFDDALSTEVLRQLQSENFFAITKIDNHILTLKRATYLAKTNQINVETMLSKLLDSASGICRFFFFCEDSSAAMPRKLRLLGAYTQFLNALCNSAGTILCAPKSSILLAMTNMIVFMVLLADSQPEISSYCFSALIDIMRSCNLTDVMSCLILLSARLDLCMRSPTASAANALHLLDSIPTLSTMQALCVIPAITDTLSPDGSLLQTISNVLIKLWAKVCTPSINLISLAHSCRLDVANHIFRCSDLFSQRSLYAVIGKDNILVNWKELSTAYPDFITTVAKNTCPITSSIPELLNHKPPDSTLFILEDILQALNTFCLTIGTGTSKYSSLSQSILGFIRELCLKFGTDIYLYIRSSIGSSLRNFIEQSVAGVKS